MRFGVKATNRSGVTVKRRDADQTTDDRGQTNIKFEILSTKHETNPNDQNSNEQNGKDLDSFSNFRLEHWRIRILNLFRISLRACLMLDS